MVREKEFAFIDQSYKPSRNDLICLFKVTPNGMSLKEAINNVALESSIGTWTPVSSNKKYVNKLGAKAFAISEKRGYGWVKIAYPQDLFEFGSVPNILSSIAGNVFGMKAIKGLRLEDIKFPQKLLKSFPGPRYGIEGYRKMMKIKDRPFVGTIVKPKLGLKTKDHARVAYDSWVGGCDLVKDDENLSSQKFNLFDKRAAKTLEMCDKAQEETGDKKGYLINVTAEALEMLRRADLAKELGGKFVMHDIITAGFSSLQTLRENTTLGIHAHRAMHGAFTENPNHGLSMMCVADFSRVAGVDSLHIGTGIGKMKGGKEEVKEIDEEMEQRIVSKTKTRLDQNWSSIKPVFSVCSGGIYPGHVPYLMKNFGKDIIIQAGGGIHGHPKGTKTGATALRQAVDATMKGETLHEYGKTHEELMEAMDSWGTVRF
ncbi:type III ribulose-bisphosphate carboxylase [archaeon]|jgi:ribulose-bisphosphate carboxylase large chain|nr:type III ribulose-bisphosphate carboxylase [archaeon]MBT3577631.1 type III ribulose-bisphosphate carboxylase [archaeon]MBT6819903.1 type III ribulose-bisphosphate carboxylase [archaeon]MBT6956687.1 type III ribulose-bisphosphate carboxylase [archaeon]MBT7025059.1 type III ribulose-bisphosphate carboxylase [archaeon]